MTPAIPQELTDVIVDELSLTGTTTELKALAQVSRAFNVACSRHVFHTIKLNSAQASDFLCFQRATPHLSLYIRDVRIMNDTFEADAEDSWLALSLILDSLNLLHSFTLSFLTPVGWGSFADETRAALVRVLSLPSLHSTTLRGLNQFPPSLMAILLPLHHLELNNVSTKGYDPALSPANTRDVSPSNLMSLSLGGASSSAASVLIKAFSGHSINLKELVVSPCDRDNLAAMGWYLASTHAASLTHLEWRPSFLNEYAQLGAAIQFNTPHFANLRDLTFLADLGRSDPFEDLILLLRRLALNNVIEKIVIDCLSSNISANSWQNLDSALSDVAYSHLKCVEFSPREGQSLGIDIVLERLPMTRAKSILLCIADQTHLPLSTPELSISGNAKQ